jgi:hypothetical protein
MAGGISDEDDIFQGGNAPETTAPATPTITAPDPEAQALSNAIQDVARQGGRPATVPTVSPPPAPAHQQEPAPQTDPDRAGLLKALLDERDRRQQLSSQLERYQKQEEEAKARSSQTPVDQLLFEAPQKALDQWRDQIIAEHVAPIQTQLTQMAVNYDMRLAEMQHGDTFREAYSTWFNHVSNGQAPVDYFRVMNAPSPGNELVEWFKEAKAREVVGNDPEAFRARIEQEILAKYGLAPGGQAAPAQVSDAPARGPDGKFAPRQTVRLPTATSRMGNAAVGGNDEVLDGSDDAIFDAARPKRR